MGPNTSAYLSCSTTLNGEMFVFGGSDSFKTQVRNLYAFYSKNDLVKQSDK